MKSEIHLFTGINLNGRISVEKDKVKVPWFDLYMDEAELNEVIDTIKSTWIGQGPRVAAFEKRVAGYLGTKHAIAVSSGTAALDIALKLVEIKPEDDVVVPGMAYIATVNSVLFQNASPVFADIHPVHFGLDPDSVKEWITEKTKCIIPINYGGLSINWAGMRAIADARGIKIIEDGAASFGGEYQGRKLCTLGDIGITSFHIAKIFTTVEGGMIFTDDDEYAMKARMIRSHGEDPDKKYWHPMVGHNYRMTDLHVSIGLVQFSRIDELLNKRAELAEYYSARLDGVPGITIPQVEEGCRHSWFIYPLLVEKREEVRKYLTENGVETNVSWPFPAYEQLHLNKFKRASLPVTEKVTSSILGLPMFFKLTAEQQDYVIDQVKNAALRLQDNSR